MDFSDSDDDEAEKFAHLTPDKRDGEEETKQIVPPQEIELRQSMLGLSKSRK